MQYWGDELRTATTEERRTEAARKLLQAQADNLWTIGTVGQAPHPVVTSTRLKNVTPTGTRSTTSTRDVPGYKPVPPLYAVRSLGDAHR